MEMKTSIRLDFNRLRKFYSFANLKAFENKMKWLNSISVIVELIVFMFIDLRALWELLVTCLRSNSHRDRYYFIIVFALHLIEVADIFDFPIYTTLHSSLASAGNTKA